MSNIYEQLTDIYYQLIDKAHEARAASYSPYSGIAVGAALLASSGRIYLGANIENASYSPTICAERVAFFKAISAGEREFVAIAVVGAKAGEEPSGNFPPCGVCRQVMSEFCGPEFMIVLGTRDNFEMIPFAEILPHSFTKENLESPKEPTTLGSLGYVPSSEDEDYDYEDELEDELEEDEEFEVELYEDLEEELYDDEITEDELDELEKIDGIFDDEEELDEYLEEDASPLMEESPAKTSMIFEFAEAPAPVIDEENLHELNDRWEI
jgi:cytidine deaminase